MFIDEKTVKRIKETYPAGTKIILNQMGDDPRPVDSGTRGIVDSVDDIGTVHCTFENGRCLGLIVGEDNFSIIKD